MLRIWCSRWPGFGVHDGPENAIIDAVNDKRLEVVRLLDENASLRATNKRLQDQNKRLKAENEIIRELEGQVMKLTRENDRMMKRIALLSAGLSN